MDSTFTAMIKRIVSILILLPAAFQSRSQDAVPLLKGRVDISINRGTFECDLTLSNIPKISDYYIRLNSGMNIRYIKNANGYEPLNYEKSSFDSLSSGETAAYYMSTNNEQKKYLPGALQIKYVGMYPVIADTSSVVDWKGNIAFNGRTVRTDGRQSAWYPVLYDVKRDLVYDKVAYDLDIHCADCETIYVNGSAPVSGTQANLKSDKAQEIAMFAGNYKAVNVNGNYFLNLDMTNDELKDFEATLHDFKNYMEQQVQIPYKGNPVYIQTTPVSRYNSWLFATYPTIVSIGFGDGMKSFIDKTKRDGFKPYMAHELGHYYFGTVRRFNAELGDMLSEGFAEYLSLQVTRKFISDSVYRSKLESKIVRLRNFKPTPFAAVNSKNDYVNRELYVYYYAPLVFTAIAKEIGAAAMWKWIRSVLQTPAAFTNYQFIEQTLGDVLKNNEQLDRIRSKYFTAVNAVDNVTATLGINPPDQTVAGKTNDTAKTYYYFFFSKPLLDRGSPENRVVKHSKIAQITCSAAELSKIAAPKFKLVHAQCENEGGCTADFNTYPTLESAEAALTRWSKPFTDTSKFTIKTFNF